MKHYKITYWKGENDESGCFQEMECLIAEETIDLLFQKKPPTFIKVVIDDGEIMIIPTTNINCIKQVYKAALERF